MGILVSKQDHRQALRHRLEGLTTEQNRQRSVRACDLLAEQPEFQQAEIVMVFLSLPHEINTTSLVLRAWQERKRVLAPRINWQHSRMLPVEIDSLTEDLEDTELQLRQPMPGNPVPPEMIDLVVVPGLGFDAFGNRLGRGRGFYDRFLSRDGLHATACALAFEEQMVERLPSAAGDVRMHMLVTDARVRRFQVPALS